MSRNRWLKFRIFYQENMTLEELARHRPPLGRAPDAEVVKKILTQEYQFKISYFVSGEHDPPRGGTRSPSDEWCS